MPLREEDEEDVWDEEDEEPKEEKVVKREAPSRPAKAAVEKPAKKVVVDSSEFSVGNVVTQTEPAIVDSSGKAYTVLELLAKIANDVEQIKQSVG